MNQEKSCGAVLFTRRNGEILFVIVQETSGAYSFPKGHMESNETETQTAAREIREETGLSPVFLPGFRETDDYDLSEKPGTHKQVVYFLAEYGGEPLIPRQGEIRQILLLPYAEVMQRFQHEVVVICCSVGPMLLPLTLRHQHAFAAGLQPSSQP